MNISLTAPGAPGAPGVMPNQVVEHQVQDNGLADFAYQVLKYGTLATAAIGSGMLMTTGLGTLLVAGATVGGSYFAISHVFKILGSLNNADSADASVAKVDRAFKIVLWTALIVGAIALGYSGASIFCGASTLLSGIQAGSAFEVLLSLSQLTFAIGFTIPFGKWLLLNLHSLDEKISSFIQQRTVQIREFENINPTNILYFLIGYFTRVVQETGVVQEGNIDIDMLHFLPNSQLQDYVRQNAYFFSNEKLQQLVRAYPNVLTYQFLCDCLSDDQINAIIIPELNRAIDSLGKLDAIEQDIINWTQTAKELNAQYQEDLSEEKKASLCDTVTPILQTMMAHTNAIHPLSFLMRKLPTENVNHNNAQQKFAQLKTSENRIRTVHQALINNEVGSLKHSFTELARKTAPKNANDDLGEEAYETLSKLGWRLNEFKQFAPKLSLPKDDNAITAVSQALAERGLGTQQDLLKYGILDRSGGQELTRDLLNKRLTDFVNDNRPAPAAAVQGAAVDGVSAAPVQNNDWALTLHRIAVVANHAFHYLSAAALIGIQVYYRPISTLTGFAIGLFRNEEVEAAQLARVWQASPNYVSQSLDERCRELWWRIFWTTNSIRWGLLGVFAGLQHASAIRFYARPWINRAIQAMA